MSNTARFFIGLPLSIPALILAGGVFYVGAVAGHGLGAGNDWATALGLSSAALVLLAIFVLALVRRDTRFYAIGVFVGTAVLMAIGLGFAINEMSTWTDF